MSRPKVLVTSRWPQAVEAALAERFDTTFSRRDRSLTRSELSAALASADALLPDGAERIDAAVLEGCQPRAKLVANCAVSPSQIDVAAAQAKGITVTNTPDSLSACTADLAIMLMIKTVRQAACVAERAAGIAPSNDWGPRELTGVTLAGKTLGLVGFGRIGQAVAQRAHWGFGMKVVAYDIRQHDPATVATCGASLCGSIDELVAQADFLSLHCPVGPETRHLVDARRLNLMKPGAFLINTARGDMVDGQALLHALWFDTIAGAALDTYEGEAALLEQLKDCPTAVLTPHLKRAQPETRESQGLRVVQNIEDFFAGRQPRDAVSV
ncbi:MAG: NAD(P)-dependent oxidoreductase [Pseudomonadota bacterium]